MKKNHLTIQGGQKLSGSVTAAAAKNAILPILASTIMLDGETTLTKIPLIGDVQYMIRMLNSLNIRVEYRYNDDIHIVNQKKIKHIAPYELVTSMRASFFVAGPLIAKTGYAKVPLPGGCSIGQRPVDIHLKGLEALGAKISIEHGFVEFAAPSLNGSVIDLGFPSVGATENIMMAACLAKGETVIKNAAKEPEVIDLANFLIKAGGIIDGVGTDTIHIQGVQGLTGVQDYTVISDRIEVGTLLIAGAITGGDVTVENGYPEFNKAFIEKLEEIGLSLECSGNAIRCKVNGALGPITINTEPFPGFPTDMQAQVMALLTTIKGKSVVNEKIFENRFMHAQELQRMGAKIDVKGQQAIINGTQLSGAEVKMTDLRAGAALVLAALAAEGETSIYGLHHLERGYHKLTQKLINLGANIIQ